jgi:hypothetical protein
MNYKDVDPKIKRFFPWALFLALAALLAFGAMIVHAHAQGGVPDNITCAEVVQRVGLKPLWVAEREARKLYPEITEAQIAWGRRCVLDHRKEVLRHVTDKVKGYF